MKQFGFETNIERRSPFTGNVFMIDRMTSQWAEEHPLDVDAYIEQVWQKYQAMAQENPQLAAWAASREQLRKMWDDVLGDMNPRGNAKLYPNRDGRQQPALMEVWLKAGDYWRRGLRLGDVIPAMVPSFKITRIGSDDQLIERYSAADKAGTAWISLGDCDMHLLTDSADSARGQVPDMEAVVKDNLTTETTDSTSTSISNTNSQSKEVATAAAGENNPGGAVREDSNPILESNDAPAAMSGDRYLAANKHASTDLPGTCPLTSKPTSVPAAAMPEDSPQAGDLPRYSPQASNVCPLASNIEAKPKRQRRQKKAAAEKPQPQQLSLFDEELLQEQQEESVEKKLLRSVGYLAAAAAAIVFVWQTGLIIPLGLIGLGASGLLK